MLAKISRKMALVVALLAALLAIAGCATKEQIAYQEKVNTLKSRYSKTGEQLKADAVSFGKQAEGMATANPAPTLQAVYSLLDTYKAKFQQSISELQQIHVEMTQITPPREYQTAHSIYLSAMSIVDASLPDVLTGFDTVRSSRSVQEIEQGLAVVGSVDGYLQKASDNFDNADRIVFATEWDLIIAVILGTLALAGCVIAFFYFRSRRKSVMSYSPQSVPDYGFPGAPPAPGGYPLQTSAYAPPSEAYTLTVSGQDEMPGPPGWAYPAPGEPPPAAPQTGSGFIEGAPWKTQIICPHCSARFVPKGGFCPSCGGILPGLG